MKFSTCNLSVILTFVASVAAAGFEKRAPGVVAISIYKSNITNSSIPLGKRSKTVSPQGLKNAQESYLFDFELGTPPQKLNAAIDTGSSDLIVYDTTSSGSPPGNPLFGSGSSSTYIVRNGDVAFGYGSGGANGNWSEDTLKFGPVTLPEFQFGDIIEGSTPNIFGIGFASNEAVSTYLNLPVRLKSHGYTAVNAYSLYLDGENATTGTILFGGLDTDKYSGPLVTLPLVDVDDDGDKTSSPVAFFVNIESVSGTTAGKTTSFSSGTITALLDSGTTEILFISQTIAANIAKEFGFTSDGQGNYVKPLKDVLSDTTSTINFKFANNLTIKVPLTQAVIPDVDGNGNPVKDPHGNQYALLLVNEFEANILGDGFLRSAYVVYDLDNSKVAIAQAKFQTASSNIVAITSAGIPGAIAAT